MAIVPGANNTTSNNTANAAITFMVPAASAGAFLLLCAGAENDGGVTPTFPGGWNVALNVTSADVSTNSLRLYLLWRLAASEPASYTVTYSTAVRSGGSIQVYTGVDPITPIDAAAVWLALTGAGTTINAPALTTQTNDALVVSAAVADVTSSSWTQPAGYTSRWGATGRTTALADKAVPVAGVVPAATWTMATANLYRLAAQIALRPYVAPIATPLDATARRRLLAATAEARLMTATGRVRRLAATAKERG